MAHAEELKAYEERVAEGRKRWGRGPWDDEPDRVEFEHAGFPCLIVRSPGGGNLCGYVGVPPGHPWHGKDFSGCWDEEITGPRPDVHGGLTYSEHCAGAVCHIPKPGEPDAVFWVGFDCAHLGDHTPRDEADAYYRDPTATYKGIGYVTAETRRLAEQAKAAEARS